MNRTFNVIAAVTLNSGIIGDSRSNSIPWHLPTDLKQFKALTQNSTIVMGLKTYESLGQKNLPERRNVVLTSNPLNVLGDPDAIYSSFGDVLKFEEPGFWVIGGSRLYDECLNYGPGKIYLTIVDDSNGAIKGDVRFPFPGSAVIDEPEVEIRGKRYSVISWLWQEENNTFFKFVELTALATEDESNNV